MLTDEHLKDAIVPRFRETILPHKPKFEYDEPPLVVVVSMDFNAQELRNIGHQSQDENLVACYVGDNKKDMHSITGHAILKALKPDEYGSMEYDEFAGYVKQADLDKEFKKSPLGQVIKDFRARGKKTNFTTEYGAMAPKLAATMLVTEEEAQMFIDAREAAFPRVAEWKTEVIAEAHAKGFVTTMLGARRHLRNALRSGDRFEASKAERQAVNFKVQGSCGEQTKLAEGRMWDAGIFFKYDAVCLGPIHDEVVASVVVDENFKSFIREMHACMVAQYADMSIPIVSSISFGPNFGVQFEIGEEPTDEAIEAGLAALRKAMAAEEATA
jgi:DNA polymerase I-like protein with 3'-5' exonuclease and polymerase domains